MLMASKLQGTHDFISARCLVCVHALAILMLCALGKAVADQPGPSRVVSMNLCTDQLAMLIARPGQLHSVSYLASDADASVMADRAAEYTVNHGRAEEIFLMQPDLVIAGTFTTRATVRMLKKLGFRVEEFAPASSFSDIRANLRRMGQLLGQEQQAEQQIAAFDAALQRHAHDPKERPLAALYYANSYTSGSNTLADEVLAAAGVDNLGHQLGYRGTTKLPLEVLVMNTPDIVIGGRRYGDGYGHAYDNLVHPALEAIPSAGTSVSVPDKYWICGTPFTAEAVRILSAIATETAE